MVTTVNVLIRYIFNSSIPGYSDICVFCFAWSVFLGMSACYKRGMHYGVDFLMEVLPPKGKSRKILKLVIDLLIAVCAFFALYLAYILFSKTLLDTGRVSSYLHLSYGYMYFSGVLAFLSLSIYSIIYIYRDVKVIFAKEEEETC